MNETKPKLLDPKDTEVVFVSEVSGMGFMNGVVNVTLSQARFTPNGKEVDIDLIIASRLRMDLFCATSLRDSLTKVIEQNTKGPAQPIGKSN